MKNRSKHSSEVSSVVHYCYESLLGIFHLLSSKLGYFSKIAENENSPYAQAAQNYK